MKKIQTSIAGELQLGGGVRRIRHDSNYLITSNQDKCKALLSKDNRSSGDIIEILISLHLCLEAGMNALFRELALETRKKQINEIEISKNIDGISFLHKTILFVYNSSFDFKDKLAEASNHHSLIKKLIDFSSVRNQLIHGHSISTILEQGRTQHSPLKQSLNEEFLQKQLRKYRDILESMHFYLECLNLSIDKERLKKEYLNDSFIPTNSTKK